MLTQKIISVTYLLSTIEISNHHMSYQSEGTGNFRILNFLFDVSLLFADRKVVLIDKIDLNLNLDLHKFAFKDLRQYPLIR